MATDISNFRNEFRSFKTLFPTSHETERKESCSSSQPHYTKRNCPRGGCDCKQVGTSDQVGSSVRVNLETEKGKRSTTQLTSKN